MINIIQPYSNALNKLKNAAVTKVLSNVPPPNAKTTADRKGSDKTLVDSGEMYGAIDYRIKADEGMLKGEVGIFEEEIAKRAAANEFGVAWEDRPGKGRRKREEYYGAEPTEVSSTAENRAWFIPPRPFLRPSFDENVDRVAEEMAEEIFKQIEDQW